jgi:glycosyltransferase involved in cell wall biosynthesis
VRAPSVLLVSHGGGYDGGAEFVFRDAVSALRAGNTSVIAIFPAAGALLDDAELLGADAHVMSVPRWAEFHRRSGFRSQAKWACRHVVAVAEALWFLRKHRPSVVVTNTLTPPSFAIAARLISVPHVWMVHELGSRDHDPFQFLLGYERTVQLISSLSRTVICCSRAVEQSLLDVVPEMRTRVIYNGIASDELPFRPRRPGPMRAALLGLFSEVKGQRVAVEALAKARCDGADIELMLVGPGDATEIQQLAKSLGVERYVACRPRTTSPLEVWRDADVALMCSRDEAFGRVTVEAMRASLPVCGADSGGTREIVANEVNGLLFEPGDSASLAAKLVRLAADEPLREFLARGAAKTGSEFGMARYREELTAAILGWR